MFQFNPFYFVADVTAMLALRVGSSSIASIKVTLKLEGPTPWKAQGDARLKLCWFLTVKIHFSKTFGETRNTTLPDLIVLPLVVAALTARDNWTEERPSDQHRLESLRALPTGASEPVRVHPVGTLAISQKVVPLGIQIDRIGAQRPADARTFAIDTVVIGTDAQGTPEPAEESFAPAQYFDLSDDEKLASPSFRTFASGIRVGEESRMRTGYAAAREVKYELKFIDSERDQRLGQPAQPGEPGLFDVDVGAFNVWTLQGAISKSDLSFARRRKSTLAPAEVNVVQEPFAIVHADSLALFDAESVMGTERAALKRRDALIASNPALRNTLQVVPVFEMSRITMASRTPTDYEQLVQRAADVLFQIPGVVSVGLGGKITGGQRTDKLSLTVMVLGKKPTAELAPGEIIPAEIEGFVTDVVQGQPPRPIAEEESPEDFDAGIPRDEAEYAVIVGGIRIRAERSRDFERRKFFGTLGCFVVDKKDANKRYLLTNHHVLADEFGEINGPSCTGCTKGDGVGNPDTGRQVANVERGKDDEFVDAAIAVLNKGLQFVREIVNDNAPNQRELVGPPRILVPHNPSDLNITVHKRGHRSRLTEAIVGDIVAIMNPKIGKFAKRNQIRIDLPEKITGGTATFAAGGKMIVDNEDLVAKGVRVHDVAWVDGQLNHGRYLITAVGPPLQPNELIVAGDIQPGGPSRDAFFVTGPMFGLHGDSGSIVLDANSRVVGLLWAANSFNRTGNAWAIPIDAVQSALSVNVDTATNIGDIQVAAAPRVPGEAGAAAATGQSCTGHARGGGGGSRCAPHAT